MIKTVKPVRLQRSRKRGARMVSPNGLPIICVTRPGKWGNPFTVWTAANDKSAWDLSNDAGKAGRMRIALEDAPTTAKECVELYRWWLLKVPQRKDDPMPDAEGIKLALRGKNLACYCALDQPCHADVLLEIANG